MVGDFIRNLFKLNQGECRKIFHFALLGAFLQAGISVGLATADTLFLSQVGADKLPYVYLFTPLVFFAYIPIYSYLLGRFGIDHVFQITMGILVLGGLILTAGFSVTDTHHAVYLVYAAKLYSVLWYIALYTLFWNFADTYFDILDAKRLFSFLSAGAALGAAFGGALVTVLTGMLEVPELFAVWSAIAGLTLPIFTLCRRSWKRIEVEDLESAEEASVLQQTKSLLQIFRSSRYAFLLGTTLFATMTVTLVCEYQYSAVFSKHHDEEGLAQLFGALYFGVHLINLFINLFVFNRLALFIGIRNVALIQPCCYAFAFLFFLLDNSYYAGVLGFVAYHGILTSIDYNATNLLLNALPAESKRQLRTFIEGICEPTANAVAGIFLLFFVAYLSPEHISAIGLLGSCACLVLVLGVRTAYIDSMLLNLKQSWLDFSTPTQKILVKLQHEEVQQLKEAVIDPNAIIEPLAALEVLIGDDADTGLSSLFSFLESTTQPEERNSAALLLVQMLSGSGKEIQKKISAWLISHEERIPAGLRTMLKRFDSFLLGGVLSRGFVLDLLGTFSSSDVSERTAALCILGALADGSSVEPLLSLSPAMTPRERRKVEEILHAVGLKGVPTTLAVLREETYSYQARSIAARSIGKIAFPQLAAISLELILAEIKRAYEFNHSWWVLSQNELQNAGGAVLRRFYKDAESRAVEFVLELLTISGKLANYELIASSLRSGNPKERANAIETVQQACPRYITHMLFPLICSHSAKDKVRFSSQNYGMPEPSLSEILSKALEKGSELESSAAAQALWDRTECLDRSSAEFGCLKEKLQSLRVMKTNGKLMQETLITLLCRDSVDAPLSDPTSIEKMFHLLSVEFFSDCPAADLCRLAQGANLRWLGDELIYDFHEKAESFFVVCDGRVILEEESRLHPRIVGVGGVFGKNCLDGRTIRLESAQSEGCVLLEITKQSFLACARSDIGVMRSILKNSLRSEIQARKMIPEGELVYALSSRESQSLEVL